VDLVFPLKRVYKFWSYCVAHNASDCHLSFPLRRRVIGGFYQKSIGLSMCLK